MAFLVLVLTISNEGAYLTFLSQSSIRPSICFSSIVKSRSNPFLEPTSTKQVRVKFLAQGNMILRWIKHEYSTYLINEHNLNN